MATNARELLGLAYLAHADPAASWSQKLSLLLLGHACSEASTGLSCTSPCPSLQYGICLVFAEVEVKLLGQADGQKQSVMVDHCLRIPDRKLTNTSRMSMNPITSVQSSGASDSEQATTGALKIFCADRTCKATRLSAEGSQSSNTLKDDLTRLSTFSA